MCSSQSELLLQSSSVVLLRNSAGEFRRSLIQAHPYFMWRVIIKSKIESVKQSNKTVVSVKSSKYIKSILIHTHEVMELKRLQQGKVNYFEQMIKVKLTLT